MLSPVPRLCIIRKESGKSVKLFEGLRNHSAPVTRLTGLRTGYILSEDSVIRTK